MRGYTEELGRRGNYPLMIWPEHCLIGSPGHAVQAEVADALRRWQREGGRNVDYVTKGVNAFTEHYGGLMAEVPLPSDPSTALDTAFLRRLAAADMIAVGGEALSHCVKATVDQIADNIGGAHIGKLQLLTDCMSSIPKVGNGPDFPALSADWLRAMQVRGAKLVKSDGFLA
jgi:nicotinamidase/pyrazinamidase